VAFVQGTFRLLSARTMSRRLLTKTELMQSHLPLIRFALLAFPFAAWLCPRTTFAAIFASLHANQCQRLQYQRQHVEFVRTAWHSMQYQQIGLALK
jgi:hypothetical protein